MPAASARASASNDSSLCDTRLTNPMAQASVALLDRWTLTFTAAGGGLMALVIAKPIFMGYATQSCFTFGGVAYGSADEFQSLIHFPGAPQVKDGAVLNFISCTNALSLASMIMTGTIETVWN